MINDSSFAKGEHSAPVATMKRGEADDFSRLEGEGGLEAPEQRIQDQRQADPSAWKEIVARYQEPALWRGVWQVVNTLVPYAAIWYLMHLSLAVSWWITVPLAILAGGFLVRVFIIFHDCGHGSFFRSRKVNDILGFITGVLTFAPYYH